jgi:hypothetical protein
MKNDCAKWKDQLLEAALTGTAGGGLEKHVSQCANCAGELNALRVRQARLDALLPLVARAAEPSADFHARVLAAAHAVNESKPVWPWRAWALAGASAAIVAALLLSLFLPGRHARTVPETELAAAEKLAEWRAPSDVLLQAPAPQILRSSPKLGESYLHAPVKTDQEE